ncbi:MAG: hypothetical protein NVS4B12_16930 [Ktedonobacteraceae bacterium]
MRTNENSIDFDTRAYNPTNALPYIPPFPQHPQMYTVPLASAIESSQAKQTYSEAKVKFHDPLDQRAWEIYKKIEPRYSDANRRLGQ